MDNFGQLLEKELPKLRRYARALKRNDVSAADDLVQDVCLRALAKQHLWQPGTNLQSWLFTLMHNENVNQVRRSYNSGLTVELALYQDSIASLPSQGASLAIRDVEKSLDKISPEQRQIILLVGLEGQTYEEAAMLVGVPTGTVRSRLSWARAVLRRHIEGVERPRQYEILKKQRAAEKLHHRATISSQSLAAAAVPVQRELPVNRAPRQVATQEIMGRLYRLQQNTMIVSPMGEFRIQTFSLVR